MNKKTELYTKKIAKIIEKFPLITKAVVVGSAIDESFSFDENIMLAIYTKPEAKISTTCVNLNRLFGDNNIFNVDIYMMSDKDFYVEIHDLINDGNVIFER